MAIYKVTYNLMRYTGQLLGVKEDSFVSAEDGKTIQYFRLHCWNGQDFNYDVFPISTKAVEALNTDGCKFGDTFEVNLEKGEDRKGNTVYRVRDWGVE